jgi:hypothetical protein
MREKTTGLFIIIGFLAQFCSVAHLYADSIRIRDNDSVHELFLSDSLPPKEHMTLVSVVRLTANGKILGGIAAYDDAMTRRPADYVELFNNLGALLAVGWIDKFGIERLAVDRALLEEADNLEGVFVLVLGGDSV